ncbi:MAG: PBP1A family penicillin-binding protein [Candidatus Acidiferrum sp.]
MRFRLQKGFWTSAFGLGLLAVVALCVLVAAGIFTFYYVKFSRMIDARLSGHILQNSTQIFSSPARISDGQAWGADDLVTYLQRSGYRPEADENSLGEYSVEGNRVEIKPSKLSYFAGSNGLTVQFNGSVIRAIRPLAGGPDMGVAEIEPELITNLFDSSREKRRPVRYEDLPPVLVQAILSAEDKRFFEHPGFDFIRIFGAAWADIRHSTHMQGASTITMQVARTYFLSTNRTWKRKLAEAIFSFELEQRFTKQQIFEMYANEVYLGNRGSFGIRGFAEASVAYFGKDLRQLTLPECAFLAGLIRAPNYYSVADRHPERAVQARDRVLTQMMENKYATESDVQEAKEVPLKLARASVTGNEAPYFVDMVKDHLLEKYSEQDLLSSNYRVYTTLDPQLQRAAAVAIENGMKNVDALLAKKYERTHKANAKKGSSEPVPQAQIALVALDPRTGEIKALIGGRDYGQSQLNHALAHRQPGSVFKPFVYAAAFNNAVDGAQPLVTPATTVDDEPTVFEFEGQDPYTPNNYGERFMGKVTLRQALTNSLNVATVKVAEMVGYGRVVQVARQMGLPPNIKPTPAVALGAYELTPVEVAGAYTAFATMGTRAEPMYVRSVSSASGNLLEKNSAVNRMVLDPRVAYLVDSILIDVLNKGTGAQVRAKGFTLPAAGKTGTSRDGWFAGFTNNLVCVIWIGFDDNHDLGLTGGVAVAPIWADFMIRATALPGYRDVKDFEKPEGVDSVLIDSDTLEVATPSCPSTREEVYINGSQPTQLCELHGGHSPATAVGSFLSHIFGGGSPKPPPQGGNGVPGQAEIKGAQPPGDPHDADAVKATEKKKGPLQKFFGIFGDKKKKEPEKPVRDKGVSP